MAAETSQSTRSDWRTSPLLPFAAFVLIAVGYPLLVALLGLQVPTAQGTPPADLSHAYAPGWGPQVRVPPDVTTAAMRQWLAVAARAVLIASGVLSLAGIVLASMLRSKAHTAATRNGWWIAWILALFPWCYLALFAAIGAGYGQYLEMWLIGQLKSTPPPLAVWSWVGVACGTVAIALSLLLYYWQNGHRLTMARLLGADEMVDLGEEGYHYLPQHRLDRPQSP